MAKQTFTTGQVLTAAQMTSLQQTAMGGGSPSIKTTSYVLVAADAGTVIQMNSASSTTITVNTALFSAGDSVQIQNIGAGVCTVTAGTATVTTAGSLALTQWENGVLYFTSTSASIFFDTVQAGGSSPLTTKGDVYTFSTSDARLGVGANNTVLTADSAEATGLKWAAASGMTTIASGSFPNSASTYTFSSIATTYKYLILQFQSIEFSSNNASLGIRLGTKTDNHYGGSFSMAANLSTNSALYSNNASNITMASNRFFAGMITMPCYQTFSSTNNDNPVFWSMSAMPSNRDNYIVYNGSGFVTGTASYTQFTIGDFAGTQNIGGQYRLLGVN
jgi:hypothetical protein